MPEITKKCCTSECSKVKEETQLIKAEMAAFIPPNLVLIDDMSISCHDTCQNEIVDTPHSNFKV